MIVEITAEDAKLIEKALDAYEKEPVHEELITSILTRDPGQNRQERETEMKKQMDQAGKESSVRRRATIPIRAKLIEAENNAQRFS